MNCCPNCFAEQEVTKNIRQTSGSISRCDYCGTNNAPVVDVRTLSELFRPILTLYKEDTGSDTCLSSLMQKEWGLFNVDSKAATQMLTDMFSDESGIPDGFFSTGVINVTKNHEKTHQHLQVWESLKNEIITKNRFFLDNVIDLDDFERFLSDKSKRYTKGAIFYRGRLNQNKKAYLCSEMSKPPAEKATAGRANPQGIPYLYVSLNKDTALHESRAAYLDYISLGTFKLTEDTEVIKLRALKINSPFEENLFEKLTYQPFLKCLENDLAKPLRRFESELTYLPTQYICEFIKKLGYDGIEYGSAMQQGGVNLAFFDDSKLDCVETSFVEISRVEIDYHNQEADS